VLDTLAEIQERSRAVKDLEASLLELHQVFLDMAVLVEAQGEMLDNIEKQVGTTSNILVSRDDVSADSSVPAECQQRPSCSSSSSGVIGVREAAWECNRGAGPKRRLGNHASLLPVLSTCTYVIAATLLS
jgi:hypothetical protein